jgi:predicted RNA-binding protein with PUA-like domain
MNYWLLKSEGNCYSIDDLKRDKRTAWTGVRNYMARNFMVRDMQVGDQVLFYHSSSEPTGVYGLAKVAGAAHPDMTQFNKKDDHYDPKATKEKPIWHCVDVAFIKKLKAPVSLQELKLDPNLEGMLVRERGSRLSIQPVSEKHFTYIVKELVKK